MYLPHQSTVCQKIMEQLGQTDMDHAKRQVVSISMDSFYRTLTPEEKLKADRGQYNFDHPDAIDEELMYRTLTDLLAGKKVEILQYDFVTNSLSEDKKITIFPADVILFEGILTFYYPNARDLFHMKLFVDTDSDTRLARRVPRDVNEYGRDLDQVLNYYLNYVKPAFEEFCSPVSIILLFLTTAQKHSSIQLRIELCYHQLVHSIFISIVVDQKVC